VVSAYERIYALVKEIEANALQIEQAALRARREILRCPIPGALGAVVVNGDGQLLAVDLDARAVGVISASRLAVLVVQAVREAEAAVADRYDRQVSEARREVEI
jgi:DNA-binding protein YbaB